MTEVKLEPCPLCGNRAFVVGGYEIWCVTDQCLRFPPRATLAEAIAAWNTRHRIQSLSGGTGGPPPENLRRSLLMMAAYTDLPLSEEHRRALRQAATLLGRIQSIPTGGEERARELLDRELAADNVCTPVATPVEYRRAALRAITAALSTPPGEGWIGKRVRKVKGLPFGDGDAVVVADYGEGKDRRVVVKHPEGWQHIFSPDQLEALPTPPGTLPDPKEDGGNG